MTPTSHSEPPMSRERWMSKSPRVEVALATKMACQPRCCPQCGSDDICFMFDPDMLLWQCSACSDVFVERD